MKSINQLLIITFFLFIYIHYKDRNIYENYEGNITKEECVERILNNECMDQEKIEDLNKDCQDFKLPISGGALENINCNETDLIDTIRCTKMISDGACNCPYGRKHVKGVCNRINIFCPRELIQNNDRLIIDRITTLKEENKKCKEEVEIIKEENIIGAKLSLQYKEFLVENKSLFIVLSLTIVVVIIYIHKTYIQKTRK